MDDIKFDTYKEISIPATSAFKDWGAISASKDDPDHWDIPQRRAGRTLAHGGFRDYGCSNSQQGPSLCGDESQNAHRSASGERSQTAAANHLFALDDVLDYHIPAARPPIEIGKLIDDMSIFAVLTADADEAFASPRTTMDDAERAAKCLADAQNLAVYVNAGVGTPTSSVVPLSDVPSTEASYGCPFGPKEAPDIYVAWDKARPSANTASFIAKAGEYLTGSNQRRTQDRVGCLRLRSLETRLR